jgi:hypothetical protein
MLVLEFSVGPAPDPPTPSSPPASRGNENSSPKQSFLLDVPGYLRHNSFQSLLRVRIRNRTRNYKLPINIRVQSDSGWLEVEWAYWKICTNGLANVWQRITGEKTWLSRARLGVARGN